MTVSQEDIDELKRFYEPKNRQRDLAELKAFYEPVSQAPQPHRPPPTFQGVGDIVSTEGFSPERVATMPSEQKTEYQRRLAIAQQGQVGAVEKEMLAKGVELPALAAYHYVNEAAFGVPGAVGQRVAPEEMSLTEPTGLPGQIAAGAGGIAGFITGGPGRTLGALGRLKGLRFGLPAGKTIYNLERAQRVKPLHGAALRTAAGLTAVQTPETLIEPTSAKEKAKKLAQTAQFGATFGIAAETVGPLISSAIKRIKASRPDAQAGMIREEMMKLKNALARHPSAQEAEMQKKSLWKTYTRITRNVSPKVKDRVADIERDILSGKFMGKVTKPTPPVKPKVAPPPVAKKPPIPEKPVTGKVLCIAKPVRESLEVSKEGVAKAIGKLQRPPQKPAQAPVTPATALKVPEGGKVAPKPVEKIKGLKAKVKEPWEMTGKEYVDDTYEKSLKIYRRTFGKTKEFPHAPKRATAKYDIERHREKVKKALSEGKPVPPEVLADYPDLKPPKPVVEKVKVRVAKPIEELTTRELDLLPNAERLALSPSQATRLSSPYFDRWLSARTGDRSIRGIKGIVEAAEALKINGELNELRVKRLVKKLRENFAANDETKNAIERIKQLSVAKEEAKIKPFLTVEKSHQVKNTQGKNVMLPKGPYRIENLGGGKVRLIDGKKVTVYEGELGKIKGTFSDKPNIAAGGMVHGQFAATGKQKAQAHIIAKEKGLMGKKREMHPDYRKIAKGATGGEKSSIKEMTKEEASDFIKDLKAFQKTAEKKIPPKPPTGKERMERQFKKPFKEPTLGSYITSQKYYAEVLGIKPIVEPLEKAKMSLDLERRQAFRQVEKQRHIIDKLGKTTVAEKLQAKVKNRPTGAIKEMAELLDKYPEAPKELSPEKTRVFNWFRELNKATLARENEVRAKLDMEPIKERKAYVRHIASAQAMEMLEGRYPFPQDLKYWSDKVVSGKVFNPMEMQRKLADDLENLFSRDLIYATKSMLATALKEIYLNEPLKFFKEQIDAFSKPLPISEDLSPAEQRALSEVMPASTRRWAEGYVNTQMKGHQTELDENVNGIIKRTGLNGLLNKALVPFGRRLSQTPVTNFFRKAGRALMSGVLGPRPKLIIRNLFQFTHDLAFNDWKSVIKSFMPAEGELKDILSESLYLKSYTSLEELPSDIMGILEKVWHRPYFESGVFNAKKSMRAHYHGRAKYLEKSSKKKYGWADPKRTYKEPKGFLYPSERALIKKEMEHLSGVAQYEYIAMAMPEIFRHKSAIPFTRLQSWWMNYFAKFNREAIHRALAGKPMWSDGSVKLDWSDRIGWLRYIFWGGLILNRLGYERSYLFGVAPTSLPPPAQFALNLYLYIATNDDTGWGKKKKAEARRKMLYALKTFIPGYLVYKDVEGLWSGKYGWKDYLFYTKIKGTSKVTEAPEIPSRGGRGGTRSGR